MPPGPRWLESVCYVVYDEIKHGIGTMHELETLGLVDDALMGRTAQLSEADVAKSQG